MESSTSTSGEKLNEGIAALKAPMMCDMFHTPLKCGYCGALPCRCPVGRCSCPLGVAPSPSCVFYSPRIRDLLEGHKTEFETAQDHWTVVDAGSAAEVERVAEDNRKYFDEVLVKDPEWGDFFSWLEDLEVGAKIGEGGQAEIFKASSKRFRATDSIRFQVTGEEGIDLVAKVWKEGVYLRDLEQQWPPELLSTVARGGMEGYFENIYGGIFIRNGELKNRFAFVMKRQWGDLRTAMDEKMLELVRSDSHDPPFNKLRKVVELIRNASRDLCFMHKGGVLHRDIKASNVFLEWKGNAELIVSDYECSMGVIGTAFWRAPEILEQLQRRVHSHEVVMTEMADIYSFGMLCYEIITGCIPYEGHPQNDYSKVLRGERPQLPHDLHPVLKEIVLDCWQHDPLLRPSSSQLVGRLNMLHWNLNYLFDS